MFRFRVIIRIPGWLGNSVAIPVSQNAATALRTAFSGQRHGSGGRAVTESFSNLLSFCEVPSFVSYGAVLKMSCGHMLHPLTLTAILSVLYSPFVEHRIKSLLQITSWSKPKRITQSINTPSQGSSTSLLPRP